MYTTLTTTSRLRRPAALAVVLAVGALAIPASGSAFYGPEQGSGPGTASNDSGRSNDSGLVIPDHTALNESLAPLSGSGNQGGIEQPTTIPVLSPSPTADGFDWADAALGAGAAMGLVALGAAALITVRRHERVSPAS